jgi:murein DD-endopeptidase MepM/ murein hydrolase activator NlpD
MALFLGISLILLSFMLPKDKAAASHDHVLGGPEEDTISMETGSLAAGDTLGALFSDGAVDNLGKTPETLISYGSPDIAASSLQDIGARSALTQVAIATVVAPATTAKKAASAVATLASVGYDDAPVRTAEAVAEAKSLFIQPTEGFDWGILHGHNGVDIANSCGTTIVAAADGLVIPDGVCESDDAWNGGYGRCVTIQHENGILTKYAHMSAVSVDLGDYVKQGDPIGKMGSTGKSTGCHLHFEVRGAVNPFAKS